MSIRAKLKDALSSDWEQTKSDLPVLDGEETGQSATDTVRGETTRTGRRARFVVRKGTTGKFRFNLHAANGEVVATSEAYNTKQACLRGVESARKAAADAEVDDQAAATRTTAKKPATKKPATKKTTAKRSAAKKAPAKRTSARR